MIALPKAISHGDGAATTLTAFTGMSAANAGAAENASAVTKDKTTFFIEPAPFRFDRLSADTIRPSLLRTKPGCDRPVRKRTCIRGEFTSRNTFHGKPKTEAIADFLGDSGFYRQIESKCCGKATNLGPKTVFRFRIRAIGSRAGRFVGGPVNKS